MKAYSIKTKVTVIVTALVVMISLLLSLIWGSANRDNLLLSYQNDISQAAILLQTKLQYEFDSISDNVRILSRDSDLLDYIHNLDTRDDSPLLPSVAKLYLYHLKSRFSAFLAAHPEYFQVRFISANNNGQELIRVDRKNNGDLEVIDDSELQQK